LERKAESKINLALQSGRKQNKFGTKSRKQNKFGTPIRPKAK